MATIAKTSTDTGYGPRVHTSSNVISKISAEQKSHMDNVAEKIYGSTIKEVLQLTVDQLVQSFIDFAERGVREPKTLIERVSTEIELYSALPEPECEEILTSYLNLSGYSREGREL